MVENPSDDLLPEESLLSGHNLSKARDAAISFYRKPDVKAVPALVHGLSLSEDVAIFCMLALLETGKAAVPQLMKSAVSQNEQIRGYSLEILGEMEHEEALDLILSAVEKDTSAWVRSTAAEALLRYQSPRAIAALEKMTVSPDNWLSVSACVTLNRMGKGKDLLEMLLRRFLEQPDQLRAMTSWGIVEIAKKQEVEMIQAIVEKVNDPLVKRHIVEIVRGINNRF
jgi:HEAT repeat protein